MTNANYLIDSWLDILLHQDYITGEDDEGKYEVCNGCKKKIYEHSHRLPLEDCCYSCMYGDEE